MIGYVLVSLVGSGFFGAFVLHPKPAVRKAVVRDFYGELRKGRSR